MTYIKPYEPTPKEICDTAVKLILLAKDVNGCLECHLAPVPKGYCYISLGGRNGIKIRAHRLIWMAAHGPIPDHLFVLHKCDNRRCILDDHLFLGTAHDNTQDMMAKGRGSNGNGWQHEAKKHELGQLIKQLKAEFYNGAEIARILNVSTSTVCTYLNGKYREYTK